MLGPCQGVHQVAEGDREKAGCRARAGPEGGWVMLTEPRPHECLPHLPRGNSLWDLPVELVNVEFWHIRAWKCCQVPPSALSSVLQMSNLKSREWQPPALDTPQQGQGWEASKGWLQDSLLTLQEMPPWSPCGPCCLEPVFTRYDSKEHLHRGQDHPPRRPCISGDIPGLAAPHAGPLWVGLPSRLGQLSHYKASNGLPQESGG